MNVLFLNHFPSQCGVYNYGRRLFPILKKSKFYSFHYQEVSNIDEYQLIDMNQYKFIIYNYHELTMPWLNGETISKTNIHIGLLHENTHNFFNYILDIASMPRPIFETIPTSIQTKTEEVLAFLNYGIDSNIPIIGSFGFGFTNKGFERIVTAVNNEFDEAIIKIVMPFATFGDCYGDTARYVKGLCENNNTKPNIKIMIIHDFLEDGDMLYFLNNNTINVFLYDFMHGRGKSSTIDFALSVDRPLCISNSYMFRHIYHDRICIDHRSIKQCIEDSQIYCREQREKHSNQTLIRFMELFLRGLQ
jgi:hypothetical protein